MVRAFKQKWIPKDADDSRAWIKRVFLQRPAHRVSPDPLQPLHRAFSARPLISPTQLTVSAVLLTVLGTLIWLSPDRLLQISYWFVWIAFMGNALIRLAACFLPAANYEAQRLAANENLPSYSVIVALYKEAAIVPQLVQAMLALQYPRDRLEILFALEADDRETIDALQKQKLPRYAHIVEVPEGSPRTKPRALNHVLSLAHGDLVVIYDAEDRPHPTQLMQAAAGFASSPADLVCLQAPLRPVGGKGFVARQFALEYAVQFDVLLPAMNALRLPFPLGGTSNHFKSDILKSVGGWDAYNVTEDADLGLRLAQHGYRLGLINAPTYETPPASSKAWIPQRTRWIKGYLQTLLVHTRLAKSFKLRAFMSLILGVGLSAAAAICYAPFTALLTMSALLIGMQIVLYHDYAVGTLLMPDLLLFSAGTLSAILALREGARRAGLHLRLSDLLSAPGYWCLQSVAACFALHQLVTRPFYWDKTEHTPDPEHKPLYEGADGDYGQGHDHKRHRNHAAHQALG